MDKRKSVVTKSNSTSEAKKNSCSAPDNNKKTKSSAEFQANVTVTGKFHPLKRRGVYVEKKSIKVPIVTGVRSPDERGSPVRPPRKIRRPDKKRFLTNVLTLLSKNTAGTQCCGTDSNEELFKIEKPKHRVTKKKEEVVHYDPIPPLSPAVRKKYRHKSRSLNNHVDGEIDSLIVLQSTKEIIQTPSNNSECVTTLNKKPASNHFELENNKDFVALRPPHDRPDLENKPALTKASHSKKCCLFPNEEEPKTEDIRNEKNIYNFFVDILKTTLSVCNVTQELEEPPVGTNSSHVSLVIDEVVAKKLNIEKVKVNESKAPYHEPPMSCCNSRCYYTVIPNERQEWVENFKPEFSTQYKVELTKKRKKLRTTYDSCQYRKDRRQPVPKISSVPIPHIKIPLKTKQHNKRNFVNSIKQELQFDNEEVYEKPNFFQALKVIARNKMKQSVNFQTSRRSSDDNICQLKCRKVLSPNSRSKKQPKQKVQLSVIPKTRQPNFSGYNRQAPITIYETSSEESVHSSYSLEVIGYDDKIYDKPNFVAYQSNSSDGGERQDFRAPSLNIVTAVAMSK